jgi:hypothetical protein
MLFRLGAWSRAIYIFAVLVCLGTLIVLLTSTSVTNLHLELVGLGIVFITFLVTRASFLYCVCLFAFLTSSFAYLLGLDFLGSKLVVIAITVLISIFIKENIYEKIYKA